MNNVEDVLSEGIENKQKKNDDMIAKQTLLHRRTSEE